MSFSSGTYSLDYTFATEAASPPIAISKLDTQFQGIATALSTCILRDGTGLPSANIPWNNKKITGLADATDDADALNRQAADARFLRLAGGTLTGTLNGTALAFTGNGTIGGTLGVTGAATLSSTLAVTGAVTFSSTLTATGAVTAAALIPTGSTVPANGLYLPSSNAVAIATNTTLRVTVNSVGTVTIADATSAPSLAAAKMKFHTNAGFINPGANLYTDSTDALAIGTTGGATVGLYTNGTLRLRVENSSTDAVTAVDDGGSMQTIGWRDCPQNVQDATYSFALADRGKNVHHTSGSGHTWTIPANGSVAFPVGTSIVLTNIGSGAITVAITTDTLYWAGLGTTGSRTLSQYGMATLVKISSTAWMISGTGVS